MAKYLYGASVQGIQSFIFQTNKLKEIVGASELVEDICTDFFKEKAKECGGFKKDNLLIGAAGNIKYEFENAQACSQLVRSFPKWVMEKADGITISQAVVKVGEYPDDIKELERRLRAQRNKPITIRDSAGMMVTETARQTGGVGVAFTKDGVIDKGQQQKEQSADEANKRLIEDLLEDGKFQERTFPFDISEMVKSDANKSWIAIIHADGNNLGKKLIKLGGITKSGSGNKAFKGFSDILDNCTKGAAQEAFKSVVIPTYEKENLERFPMRPVLLGGDDLTAIIRGDLALNFTQQFLEHFETKTKDAFKDFAQDYKLQENPFSKGLTACAGIAYIKASYPFHYGVTLAESLCEEAKNVSKEKSREHSPSSIMFHKVQASFVEGFDDIIDKELSTKNNVFFNYGPYFLNPTEQYDTVEDLKTRVKDLNKRTAPKSGLRNWLTELENNPASAKQTLKRLADLNSNFIDRLHLKEPFTKRKVKKEGKEITGYFTPIYDAMALSSIKKTNYE